MTFNDPVSFQKGYFTTILIYFLWTWEKTERKSLKLHQCCCHYNKEHLNPNLNKKYIIEPLYRNIGRREL